LRFFLAVVFFFADFYLATGFFFAAVNLPMFRVKVAPQAELAKRAGAGMAALFGVPRMTAA
jgi:hypothetical protein